MPLRSFASSTAIAFAATTLFGAEVPFVGRVVVDGPQIATGASREVFDSNFFRRDGKPALEVSRYHLLKSEAIVALEVLPYGPDPLRAKIEAEIDFTALAKNPGDTGGPRTLPPFTLKADYDPAPGTKYQESQRETIAGAAWISVRVSGVRFFRFDGAVRRPFTEADRGLRSRFRLTSFLLQQRNFTIPTPAAPPASPVASLPSDDGKLAFSWAELPWAEEYDLEWTFANDYCVLAIAGDCGADGTRPVAQLEYDFRFNSTRVVIKREPESYLTSPPVPRRSYSIPIVFERGYLLWRIRGAGLKEGHRVAGKWSAFEDLGPRTLGGITLTSANMVRISEPLVHEKDLKNWQQQTTYSEDGKRRSVVTYADGTLRKRQDVTKLNSDGILIAQDTIYDHAGRPAIHVLPAPLSALPIGYQPRLSLSTAGQPYQLEDFEPLGSGLAPGPKPMSKRAGASRYYSPDNPDKTGHRAYIPDAFEYPFSQTVFTDDPTGRVAAMGLPGPQLKIGAGHHQQIVYEPASQEELDRVFGNDAGLAEHYERVTTTDADGQDRVEYRDSSGRIVATALSGKATGNLVPLDPPPMPLTISKNLLSSNQRNGDVPALVSRVPLIVRRDRTPHQFRYRITPPQHSDARCGTAETGLCYDCRYSLSIRVLRRDGSVVASRDETIGAEAARPRVCQPNPEPYAFELSATLDKGEYVVEKSLSVDLSKVERQVSDFVSSAACFKESLTPLISKSIGSGPCQGSCRPCEYEASAVDRTNRAGTVSPVRIERRRGSCDQGCTAGVAAGRASCDITYRQLIGDLNPNMNGQYAAKDASRPLWKFSILNEGNLLPLLGANWKNPAGAYREPDGSESMIVPGSGFETDCPPGSTGGCRPERLQSSAAFLRYWRDTWAEALVIYHPEFGYHRWCIDNVQFHEFDALLQTTETYVQAASRGLLSPVDQDSFFREPGRRLVLDDELRRADIVQKVHFTVRCNRPGIDPEAIRECVRTAGLLYSEPEAFGDSEWRIYRQFYREARLRAFDKLRKSAIGSGTYAVFAQHDCIGTDAGSCFGQTAESGTFRPLQRRYQTVESAEAALGPLSTAETVARTLAACCNRCPTASDLQALITAMMSRPNGGIRNSANFLFPVIPSPDLFRRFSDLVGTPIGISVNPKGDGLEFLLAGSRGTQHVFERLFELKPARAGSPVVWEQLRAVACLRADSDRDFAVQAIDTAGQAVEIAGSFAPAGLKACRRASEHCATSQMGLEFAQMVRDVVLSSGWTGTPIEVNLPSFSSGGRRWRLTRSTLPGWTLESESVRLQWFVQAVYASNSAPYSLTAGSLLRSMAVASVFARFAHGENRQDQCQSGSVEIEATDSAGELVLIRLTLNSGPPAWLVLSNCCMASECSINGNAKNCFANLDPRSRIWEDKIEGSVFLQSLMRSDTVSLQPADACSNCCPAPFPSPEYRDNCERQRQSILISQADKAKLRRLEAERAAFRRRQIDRCLSAVEAFDVTFTEELHHYTLYYYDRAGYLARTVPPKGVQLVDATRLSSVALHRTDPGRNPPLFPAHSMDNRHEYTSSGKIFAQATPDSGLTKTWFDNLSRPTLAQNAHQAMENAYGYTLYDELGRVVESGELRNSAAPPGLHAQTSEFRVWIGTDQQSRTETLKVRYDRELPGASALFPSSKQEHLRKRIASKTYVNRIDEPGYAHSTHYSYDIHGYVKELVQANPQMPDGHQAKLISYEYDILTGRPTLVAYQPQTGATDQFIHRYEYDADLRLRTVGAGPDRLGVLHGLSPGVRERDAEYSFYPHGPLARRELGTQRVQGIDYAYTLLGQLKAINSDTVRPERDIGKDGLASRREVAVDAYGFSLGYFQGDYQPVGVTADTAKPIAHAPAGPLRENDLFGGAIRNSVSAPFQGSSALGTAYRYDQLHRLRSSELALALDRENNVWRHGARVSTYSTSANYDPNGNVAFLKRYTDGPRPIVESRFQYSEATNRLNQVVPAPGPADPPYSWDASGRMTSDASSRIRQINWTASSKLHRLDTANGTVRIAYDSGGHRSAVARESSDVEWYVRDDSGRLMGIYQKSGPVLRWKSPIYGMGRLGLFDHASTLPSAPGPRSVVRGHRQYELVGNTGDVLKTVDDRKHPMAGYSAFVGTEADYLPFGFQLADRQRFPNATYPFGFQGMMLDPSGDGRFYTTELRTYDPDILRWWSPDPVLTPSESPYTALGNDPINLVDPLGAEPDPCPRCDRLVSGPSDSNADTDRLSRREVIVVAFTGHAFSGGPTPAPADPDDTTQTIVREIELRAGGPSVAATRVFQSSLQIDREDTLQAAQAFIEGQRRLNPEAGVIIYGHSLGGHYALELSRRLSTEDQRVDLLLTVDAAMSYASRRQNQAVPSNVDVHINWYQNGNPWRREWRRSWSNFQDQIVRSEGFPHRPLRNRTRIVNRRLDMFHMQTDEAAATQLLHLVYDFLGARVRGEGWRVPRF